MTSFTASSSSSSSSKKSSSNDHNLRAELSRPPCPHYNRNCTIIAPCCGAAFGCRICHDDSPVLPPLIQHHHQHQQQQQQQLLEYSSTALEQQQNTTNTTTTTTTTPRRRKQKRRSSSMPMNSASMPQPEHHKIDRFAIQEIICRSCYTRQSSKTNKCIHCHIQFGQYHCSICNLWTDKTERPFHCYGCGFCRVGGAENFRHCYDCGLCIDKIHFTDHNCKVGKYMSNCPVCQEDLFSSRSPSHEMPCGHAIHWDCFRQLAAHDSRCPVCKKTAETHERMMPTWNSISMNIQMQPIPPDLAKVVNILCNDCEVVDMNRSWHYLGIQCRYCSSFNTVVENVVLVGPEAYAFHATKQQQKQQKQKQQVVDSSEVMEQAMELSSSSLTFSSATMTTSATTTTDMVLDSPMGVASASLDENDEGEKKSGNFGRTTLSQGNHHHQQPQQQQERQQQQRRQRRRRQQRRAERRGSMDSMFYFRR